MSDNYSYPLMDSWSQSEIISVITFFQSVEEAYEKKDGVNRQQFMDLYRQYTQIVPSKMEQKQLEREFKKSSFYDTYQVFKKAKETKNSRVVM